MEGKSYSKAASVHKPLRIYYDCEAANSSLFKGDIIEIAARFDPSLSEASFESLIKTTQELGWFAVQRCGITKDALADQLFFPDVIDKFFKWIQQTVKNINKTTSNKYFPVLCAHGGLGFDFIMLLSNMKRHNIHHNHLKKMNLHFADSFDFCKKLQASNFKALCGTRLSMEGLFSKFCHGKPFLNRHRAIGDVNAMVDIFANDPLKVSMNQINHITAEELCSLYEKQYSCKEQKFILEEKMSKLDAYTKCVNLKKLVQIQLNYEGIQRIFENCCSFMDFYEAMKDVGIDRKTSKYFVRQFGGLGLKNQGTVPYCGRNKPEAEASDDKEVPDIKIEVFSKKEDYKRPVNVPEVPPDEFVITETTECWDTETDDNRSFVMTVIKPAVPLSITIDEFVSASEKPWVQSSEKLDLVNVQKSQKKKRKKIFVNKREFRKINKKTHEDKYLSKKTYEDNKLIRDCTVEATGHGGTHVGDAGIGGIGSGTRVDRGNVGVGIISGNGTDVGRGAGVGVGIGGNGTDVGRGAGVGVGIGGNGTDVGSGAGVGVGIGGNGTDVGRGAGVGVGIGGNGTVIGSDTVCDGGVSDGVVGDGVNGVGVSVDSGGVNVDGGGDVSGGVSNTGGGVSDTGGGGDVSGSVIGDGGSTGGGVSGGVSDSGGGDGTGVNRVSLAKKGKDTSPAVPTLETCGSLGTVNSTKNHVPKDEQSISLILNVTCQKEVKPCPSETVRSVVHSRNLQEGCTNIVKDNAKSTGHSVYHNTCENGGLENTNPQLQTDCVLFVQTERDEKQKNWPRVKIMIGDIPIYVPVETAVCDQEQTAVQTNGNPDTINGQQEMLGVAAQKPLKRTLHRFPPNDMQNDISGDLIGLTSSVHEGVSCDVSGSGFSKNYTERFRTAAEEDFYNYQSLTCAELTDINSNICRPIPVTYSTEPRDSRNTVMMPPAYANQFLPPQVLYPMNNMESQLFPTTASIPGQYFLRSDAPSFVPHDMIPDLYTTRHWSTLQR